MTETTDASTAEMNEDTAPSQIIPPNVDSGMKLAGMAVDRLVYIAPGILSLGLSLFVLMYGLFDVSKVLAVVGVVLTTVGGYVLRTTPAHTSGIDRVRGRVNMALRSWSLPLDRAGTANIHGVEEILGDGAVKMADGRIVRFARLSGRNTDLQSAEEEQTMINVLRRDIDKKITDIDWSVYSTNTPSDPTEITGKYRDVWLAELSDWYDGEQSWDLMGLLESIVDWEPERTETWKTAEWETYLVVAVGPDEIDAPPVGALDSSTHQQQQQVEAESRLTRVRKAFSSVAGLETQPIGGAEHARLIARHWAGARHPFATDVADDAPVSVWPGYDSDQSAQRSDTASRPVEPSVLSQVRSLVPFTQQEPEAPALIGDDRINELLASSQYDERPDGDMVVVGEQYARTFWIADWPTRPAAKVLKELHTMRGIDLDVHLRFNARDTERVKDELKEDTSNIDASILERKENTNPLDATVLEDEMDAFVDLFLLLHHTEIQPWAMNMYVTVRAGNRTALGYAEQLVESGQAEEADLTLDIAKQQALEDACEEVTDILTDAQLEPVTDAHRQGELFKSCSPTGNDVYAEQSHRSRERLTATGTVAATFPPCSTTVQHERGTEIGRNPTNGRIIAPDPFKYPPAHKLTVGKTGSGKTWATLKQAVRWYLIDPEERTLIFLDTDRSFSGATQLLGGNTITLDGDTTLNPLRMEPMDSALLDASGIDPFELKHQLVTSLLLDIIPETDDARDRFRPLVRDAVRTALLESGIDPNDPSTHTPANSPTMADVRSVAEEIAQNPREHAQTEVEGKEIEENIGAFMHRLRSFSEEREYSFLTGQSDATIEPGEMTYLDLQQIEGLGTAGDEVTMLKLALGQVYETVKRAPGETLFIIDEAHYLLESQELLQLLDKSSRHWRSVDAGLWFVSQSPEDFEAAEDDDAARHKGVIRDQAQTIEIFQVEDEDKLSGYGLNERQKTFITEEATRGSVEEEDHTDCLIDVPEVQGWMRSRISVSPAERDIFEYDPRKHGKYYDYLDERWS